MVGHNVPGHTLNAVAWTLTGLAAALVGMRLYSRLVLSQTAGLDDLFVTISLVCNLLKETFGFRTTD